MQTPPELPPNLELALQVCKLVARTTPTGEIWFRAIPKEYKAKGITRHELVSLEELGYLTQTGEMSSSLANTRYRLTPDKEPIHFPEAFDWWRKRYKGRRFPFECECKTEIGVLQRLTQTKRRCPNCGELITTHAIDDQLTRWEPERQRIMETEKKLGVGSALGAIGAIIAASGMFAFSHFFGKKR